MNEYKILLKKRALKQLAMALGFILIIVFGWQYPVLGFIIPLCMVLGTTIAFFRGRMWCNWYCPRGSFYDAIIAKISPKKEIPGFFKRPLFRIIFLSLLMLIMISQIIRRWPNLYNIGIFFVTMLSVTTAVGIIFAVIFHPRVWCCICPIGSIANWIGKNKHQLYINPQLCTECKICGQVCPIQVKPYLFKKEGQKLVKDGDCLKCNLCIAACSKKALTR